MTKFKAFKKAVQDQFSNMLVDQDVLFTLNVGRDELWEVYLNAFPEGTNEIYKERREYDCNCCKSFIRHYGKVVAIKNNKIVSIWNNINIGFPFDIVVEQMNLFLKKFYIQDVFMTDISNLGHDKNPQQLEDDSVITWEHFYYKLPKKFVASDSEQIESLKGKYRDSKNVFERSMKELTKEATQVILELIEQGSLYRGDEHKNSITKFIEYKNKFDKVSESEINNWCWVNSFKNPISKIRNTSIGTLLIDVSTGLDLNEAVKKFEKIMAPANYKRPKPIYTKKMVEEAEKKIVELGFSESLARKFAQYEDITVNNVLFVNRDAKRKISGSVFDDLKEDIPESPKKFDKVEEVGIEDFIKNILPKSNSIEMLVENKHNGNFMSLVAPEDKDAPSILKWNNNFSWAYNGDITDSMKQRVKAAGGNVTGELRFSIQWNDIGEWNKDDYDVHCIEPSMFEIMFECMKNPSTTGVLDVDIIDPKEGIPAVENITWSDRTKMEKGIYKLFVHNYSHRNGTEGFLAEIEFDGQVYSFEYRKGLKQGENVIVAEVGFDGENFKIINSLDSSLTSKKIWEVNTNKFSKVSVCMFSPNYWDGQKGTGNKHYFFFLENCKNEVSPRGFFNEFLNSELTPHRKVFEALSSKMRVKNSDNQLSGLGFSSTQRNKIIVKVDGKVSRMIKIKF